MTQHLRRHELESLIAAESDVSIQKIDSEVTVHGSDKPAAKSPAQPAASGGPTRRVLSAHNGSGQERKPVIADELTAVELASTYPRERTHSEHLLNCALCAARKRVLLKERASYLTLHPSEAFVTAAVRSAEQQRKRRFFAGKLVRSGLVERRVWTGLGLAASAFVLLVLLTRSGSITPTTISTDKVRYKGSEAFEVYVRHSGSDFKLRDGAALSPGDQLAFLYVISRPRYLLLVSIDDAGVITRYFPGNNESAARPLATGRAQLPVGIELDARRGQERLVAVFSSDPIDETNARQALSLALREVRARGQGIADLTKFDIPASWVTIWFRKP
jgi:hypothetical protein